MSVLLLPITTTLTRFYAAILNLGNEEQEKKLIKFAL